MRETIWNALLDSEMNIKYWKKLTQRYSRRDTSLRIFLAITSSGTVAGWGLFQQCPAIWKVLSAMAALVAIAMPLLNYSKIAETTSELSGKWWEIRNEFERQWIDVKNKVDVDRLAKRHEATKQKIIPLVSTESRIPEDRKLLIECVKEVREQYGV